jgi:hypothetical protein
MESGMKTEYKHTNELYMNTVYKSAITNMRMVQTFEVISNKFNAVRFVIT